MTTKILSAWFDLFRQHVTERPLLLIFDGHLTHISVAVIEKAIRKGIHIVKLTPHVTDKLQPVFLLLKDIGKNLLTILSVVLELAKQCLRTCLLTCFVRFSIKD